MIARVLWFGGVDNIYTFSFYINVKLCNTLIMLILLIWHALCLVSIVENNHNGQAASRSPQLLTELPIAKSVKTMKTTNLRASRLVVLVSFLMACGLLPVVASATPISFYNNASAPSGTARFTVGCGSASGDCSGTLEALFSESPLTWSSSIGQMLGGPSDASPAAETTFVNGLLGTSLTASSGNIAPGNSNSFNFPTDADYFLIKVGGSSTDQAYALLYNLGGGNLNLWFTATGQAGGLSHYITFGGGGEPTSVPEPGSLGMFGLGTLLIGAFVGLRRRMV